MVFLLLIVTIIIVVVGSVGAYRLSVQSTYTMENTARNFALQLGSLGTLYVSLTALIMLMFNIITMQYPDPISGYYEYDSASSGLRFAIALLIVFFPAYIILTRRVNVIRRSEQGTYLSLTKWLVYLSLVIGGGILLGDLVAVINSYLNGELTTRFVLKALTMLVVIGSAFTYYLFDARGYWQVHERRSIQYATGAGVIVILALILGFSTSEAPTQVREQRLDMTQIQDLSLIQSQVTAYYQNTGTLPETLREAFAGVEAPVAPDNRNAYEYTVLSATSFELCADFAYASSKTDQMQYSEPYYSGELFSSNWTHGEGHWCFTRNANTAVPVKVQPAL